MNTYMEPPRLILRDWREEDIPVFSQSGVCKDCIETQRTLFFHLASQQTFGACDAEDRYD